MSRDRIRAILKFPIDLRDPKTWIIDMPLGANVLHVGWQGAEAQFLCIWAECFGLQSAPAGFAWSNGMKREFAVFGTGHRMPMDHLDHIGTVVQPGFDLVWHVFEKRPA